MMQDWKEVIGANEGLIKFPHCIIRDMIRC